MLNILSDRDLILRAKEFEEKLIDMGEIAVRKANSSTIAVVQGKIGKNFGTIRVIATMDPEVYKKIKANKMKLLQIGEILGPEPIIASDLIPGKRKLEIKGRKRLPIHAEQLGISYAKEIGMTNIKVATSKLGCEMCEGFIDELHPDVKHVNLKSKVNQTSNSNRGISSSISKNFQKASNSRMTSPEARMTTEMNANRAKSPKVNENLHIHSPSSYNPKLSTKTGSFIKSSAASLKKSFLKLTQLSLRMLMPGILDVFVLIVESWINYINRNSTLIKRVVNSTGIISRARLDVEISKNYQESKQRIIYQFEQRKLIPVFALVEYQIQIRRGAKAIEKIPLGDNRFPVSYKSIEDVKYDVKVLKLVEKIGSNNKLGIVKEEGLKGTFENNIEWEPLVEFNVIFFLPVASSIELIFDFLNVFRLGLKRLGNFPILNYLSEKMVGSWEIFIKSKGYSPFSANSYLKWHGNFIVSTAEFNTNLNLAIKAFQNEFPSNFHKIGPEPEEYENYQPGSEYRELFDVLLSIRWIIERIKEGEVEKWVKEFGESQKQLMEGIGGVA